MWKWQTFPPLTHMSRRASKTVPRSTLIFWKTWCNVFEDAAQKSARAKRNHKFIDLEVKTCIDFFTRHLSIRVQKQPSQTWLTEKNDPSLPSQFDLHDVHFELRLWQPCFRDPALMNKHTWVCVDPLSVEIGSTLRKQLSWHPARVIARLALGRIAFSLGYHYIFVREQILFTARTLA